MRQLFRSIYDRNRFFRADTECFGINAGRISSGGLIGERDCGLPNMPLPPLAILSPTPLLSPSCVCIFSSLAHSVNLGKPCVGSSEYLFSLLMSVLAVGEF